MSRMIQIRNVPDRVHRRLKAVAAEEGLSLSDLLLREATWVAETLTMAELTERLRNLPSVTVSAEEIVDATHDAREARTDQIVNAVLRDRHDG
jgi:hypothetical protein